MEVVKAFSGTVICFLIRDDQIKRLNQCQVYIFSFSTNIKGSHNPQTKGSPTGEAQRSNLLILFLNSNNKPSVKMTCIRR